MCKVGDKVVRKPECRSDYLWESGGPGVFTVTRVSKSGDIIHIDRDGFEDFGYDSARFDLVQSAPATINDLLPLIEHWGRDRGILENSTPLGQSRKTVEEVRELVEEASALNVLSGLPGEDTTEVLDRLADAIGDVFVTLVMVAGCAKLDINACVAQAYSAIKDRKGYLRPDGVFVKEETD